MAASSISMLALLLLMSAVTPGLSTEGEGSQDHTSTALIIAMREVSRALECFGDAVQEGLRQQRQSSDALTDLHTLTATVLRVEERINQQGGMIESLKEKNEDITKLNDLQVKFEAKSRESEQNLEKVEALTQEIEDLKNQLHNKNHTVGDLQRLLDNKTFENERNVDKLDDLQVKCEAKSRESEVNLGKVGDLQRLLDNKTSENEHNVDKLNDLQVKFEAKSKESEQNLEKVEALTQEIEDLKNQLHNKNHTVGDLQRLLDNKTSENERYVHKLDDLQVIFEAKSRESEQNLEKVQDLGRKLDESRRYAEKLEQLVQQLNNTVESKKNDVPGCAEQPPQKIKNLVLQYSGSRDWQTLEKGLDAEMDHSSEAYGELKNIYQYSEIPQWYMGYRGYTQLATLLLCAGMPVDLPGTYNYTLLLGAAQGGHYQLAEMLLSHGADVNVRTIYGFTPLMGAAYIGSLETVKVLVQAGADTTATDGEGHNALYYAKNQGHTAMQQYLEQFPA